MISLKNVEKYFFKGKQNEIHVINNTSLELPDKGMISIFGPSGCGKTTLLNVIGGLDSYQSGNVLIDGKEMSCSEDEIRNRFIGYIFQNYNLNKEETVFQNVADALLLCGMDDPEQIEERVTLALKNVGLYNFRKRTPDTLSGGQQQRVAIARAIVKNPPIILADEPTGNLDENNTIMIMDILKAISKDHLVVLVTHEENLVNYYSDKIIRIRDGVICSVEDNSQNVGYTGKNKNDIFLGEYEETDIVGEQAEIHYYGEKPVTPIQIVLVNRNGQYYLKVNSEKVHLLDETSEIKLRQGVYQEQVQKKEQEERFELPTVAPAERSKYGKLFTLRTALRIGAKNNGRGTVVKRSQKMLRRCMFMFGIVLVFLVAVFGKNIRKYINAHQYCNKDIFWITENNADELIREGIEKNILTGAMPCEIYNDNPDEYMLPFEVICSQFESTSNDSLFFEIPSYTEKAHFVKWEKGKGQEVLAGNGEEPANNEVIISSALAQKLLDQKVYTYITDFEGLVGAKLTDGTGMELFHRHEFTIKAVVDSREIEVYANSHIINEVCFWYRGIAVIPDESDAYSIPDGSCIAGFDISLLNQGMKSVNIGENTYSIVKNYVLENDSYFRIYELARTVIRTSGDEVYGNLIAMVKDGASEFDVYRYIMDHVDYFDISYYAISGDTVTYFMEIMKGFLGIQESGEQTNGNTEILNIKYDYIGYARMLVVVNKNDYAKILENPFCSVPDAALHTNRPNDGYIDYFEPKTAWMVYGKDRDAVEEYLGEQLSKDQYVTSQILMDKYKERFSGDVKEQLIIMGIMIAIMTICVYLIMKTSTMNRIREIGIYRAIGVSKKNMIFRFGVEAMIITTKYVAVAVAGSYLVVSYISRRAADVSEIFYLPFWMFLIILIFVYTICIVCGIIPVLRLLRKTPSEILAKYDI